MKSLQLIVVPGIMSLNLCMGAYPGGLQAFALPFLLLKLELK